MLNALEACEKSKSVMNAKADKMLRTIESKITKAIKRGKTFIEIDFAYSKEKDIVAVHSVMKELTNNGYKVTAGALGTSLISYRARLHIEW